MAVEAEARLRDVPALQRRLALKRRDDPRIDAVVLLTSDTRNNRKVLRMEREALSAEHRLPERAILQAVGVGRVPTGGGIVVL
jgi:hypothetical protein